MPFPFARTLALAAGPLLLLGACSGTDDAAAPVRFEHIHGLDINPSDERLYVATHTGTYRLEDDGTPTRVGGHRDDFMGFRVVGPDEFIASGHPADADRPNPLGFIRSRDGGKTWETRSLEGQSDLHAIDTHDAGTVTALDSTRNAVIQSDDQGLTWRERWRQTHLLDIAAMPDSPRSFMATRTDGTVTIVEAGQETVVDDTPALTYVDVTPDGTFAGMDTDGQVWLSLDARGWAPAGGSVEGAPAAISVKARTWYAATSQGIYASSDRGGTWKLLLT